MQYLINNIRAFLQNNNIETLSFYQIFFWPIRSNVTFTGFSFFRVLSFCFFYSGIYCDCLDRICN